MEAAQATAAESAGSSPDPKKETTTKSKAEPPKPAVGTKFQLRTETPTVPTIVETPSALAADIPAAGNQAYTVELKDQGILGLYLKRPRTTPQPIQIEIIPQPFFNGIKSTLFGALTRLHRLKTTLSDNDFINRVDDIANTLASGCALTAYLKVRSIILSDIHARYNANSLRRPRASSDLPIPAAFAFAIQQLGTVKVADLPTDPQLVPCFPQTGHSFGLPTGQSWNPNAYATAVEYARSLGMRFSVVDLKVKNGSAWWLLRQHYSEQVFELICSIPEVNFTDAMAVTHTLFLPEDPVNPSNPFIQLPADYATTDFGVMLHNPHPGINLSAFEAISDTANEVWTNV